MEANVGIDLAIGCSGQTVFVGFPGVWKQEGPNRGFLSLNDGLEKRSVMWYFQANCSKGSTILYLFDLGSIKHLQHAARK
ncbi:hypothetical protein [Fodinibius halophilus]|uniref:Uncharacterized protein n=1 Tax=Fodinibius halophilus TaxID=1736908 RepID=A0A6M1T3E8_9BACT|nr:hypothetical protein [Fodinibius halophilus]NGP88589.1 hypothetical protein [Fodinibius halophilus]